MVKNLPVRQETRVQSLGWEVPLEKRMAIHSSVLPWRIPWTEKPGSLQSVGSPRDRHGWVINTTQGIIYVLTKEMSDMQNSKKQFVSSLWHTMHCSNLVLWLFYVTAITNHKDILSFSSVQSLSRVRLFATPWIAARQASLSITNSQSSLRLMSIESVMPCSHLILCHPLLLLPSIPPSIRDFSNESTLHMRWPKYWSFSFSIIPSKKQPGLSPLEWTGWISLQSMGLKSLLQHHSSKASILRRSAFFTVQLSHPYMTTGKTKALTRQTIAGKIMSLLFNMLSRLVITFLPRSKL